MKVEYNIAMPDTPYDVFLTLTKEDCGRLLMGNSLKVGSITIMLSDPALDLLKSAPVPRDDNNRQWLDRKDALTGQTPPEREIEER